MVKDLMDFIEGIYILGPNLVNGKAYWIQEGGSVALWFDLDNGEGNWNIGNLDNLGYGDEVGLFCFDESDVPIETITWLYNDGNEWVETTDVSILPAKGIL